MMINFLDALRANTIEFHETGTTPLILRGVALSIAIISVNTIISAACPVTAFPYDDMLLIEGVWRIVQGQREGADFYNPIGFGLFHVGAAWWRILGAHRYVLPLTSATFSVFIMLCASIVCARRIWFSAPYYLLICGVLAFETSAPSVYGWSFFAMGSAAFYSRLTTAALAILFIQWFGEKRSISGRQTLSERGVEALRSLKLAHEAIATIDYTNPFPSLLGMPSPKGVPIVWALGYMEQPSMLSQPRRLFGDACIVMLALRPTQVVEGNAELMSSAAKPILSAYFIILRQDEYWEIYRRQNGCS
jgi:hypothetical protein